MVNGWLRVKHFRWSNVIFSPQCLLLWKSCELRSVYSGIPTGLFIHLLSHSSAPVEQRSVLLSRKEEGRKRKQILGNSEMLPMGNTSDGSWCEEGKMPNPAICAAQEITGFLGLKRLKRFLACCSGLLLAVLLLAQIFYSFDLNFDTHM